MQRPSSTPTTTTSAGKCSSHFEEHTSTAPSSDALQGLVVKETQTTSATSSSSRLLKQCLQYCNVPPASNTLQQCLQYCLATTAPAAAAPAAAAPAAIGVGDGGPGTAFSLESLGPDDIDALQQVLEHLTSTLWLLEEGDRYPGLSASLAVSADASSRKLQSKIAAVRQLLEQHLPPQRAYQAPAPTAESLDRDRSQFFQQRQEVSMDASGCGFVAAAIKNLPEITTDMLGGACTELRDPTKWQLLQVRKGAHSVSYVPPQPVSPIAAPDADSEAPSSADALCSSGVLVKVVYYASEELIAHVADGGCLSTGMRCSPNALCTLKAAAKEAAFAGGLQEAAAAMYGKAGPFVAPVMVDLQPCPPGPLNAGYDCQVVMAFPYCPGGDGLQFAHKQLQEVFEGAATAQQAPAQQQPGSQASEQPQPQAQPPQPQAQPPQPQAQPQPQPPQPQLLLSAENTAQGVVSVLERVIGGMGIGLHALHQLGVVAGDNKLANFMPNAQGRLHGGLIDAEAVARCGPREVVMHAGVHTPCYAAPEQLKSLNAFRGHLSDVWSLGAAAKELLESAVALATHHGQHQVAVLLQLESGPAERLHRVQTDCLKDSAAERPVMAAVCAMLGLQL